MKVWLRKSKWNGASYWSPALLMELENSRIEIWSSNRKNRQHPLISCSRAAWDTLVDKGYAKHEVHTHGTS